MRSNKQNSRQGKRAYNPPRLIVYGDLQYLTKGTGKSGLDTHGHTKN